MPQILGAVLRRVGIIATLVACSCAASAAPMNGFGAYVGVVGAREAGQTSKGFSVGGDAQFVINDAWSLNPYLQVSAERVSKSVSASDSLAGIHVRRWIGNWFVGGQAFFHARVLIRDGSSENSTYGPGLGAVGGYEAANGWGTALQFDALEGQFLSSVNQRNAVRLHMTYRWH